MTETRPVCEGCGQEIDPDCCGCGQSKESHAAAYDAGHPFIPMGCDCYREPRPSRVNTPIYIEDHEDGTD